MLHTCCKGRMSLFRRRLSRSAIGLVVDISCSKANTAILYGVTQSLIPKIFAWTTPLVIMGLKYKLSCTLAMASLYLYSSRVSKMKCIGAVNSLVQ